MLIGVRSPLVEVALRTDETWVHVTSKNLLDDSGSVVERRPDEILLPLSVASLGSVARFVDVSAATGPLPPVIADAHGYLSQATLETQVLELGTVAEGLHRRLFPNEVRMDADDAKRIRSKIGTATSDEDERFRDIINGMLAHLEEMGYPRRITALADRVEIGLPGATGITKKWVQAVTDARNSYAHRTGGYLDEDSISEFFAVSSSLKWILSGVCILESGVADSTLAAQVQKFPQYRQFLKNMEDAMPSVYSAAEK